MERKAKDALGVTFSGNVTFNGPMFDIHDNQHVHIEKAASSSATHTVPSEAGGEPQAPRPEELFHFIHPAVDGSREWQIHDEVHRLVTRQGIQEICHHLTEMKKEKKVLLPQSPATAYAELVRMGMPCGEGFSEITFRKYYSCK